MNVDVNARKNQLISLQNYLKDVDTEVTMILQNLQWDRKHLEKPINMVPCQYDRSHRVPSNKLAEHENKCFLKSDGYIEGDRLLPSPFDSTATTLVKLDEHSIAGIITDAPHCQPSFNSGAGYSGHQPLTLERLQATYTTDERRAIHDAVVNRVPFCHDLSDLAILSAKDVSKENKTKSKLEILAELRDMRRRRTKYRVATKTRNYSDVLRDVIATQMELYAPAQNSNSQTHIKSINADSNSKAKDTSLDKNTVKYSDHSRNRLSNTIEGQTSMSTKDIYNTTPHAKQYEEYEIIKTKANKDCFIYDSKPKRRDDRGDSTKANRKTDKYYEYFESETRHREKEYDRKRKTRVEDDRYSKFTEKYHTYERHYSNRVRQGHGQYRNIKLSPRSKDHVDGQNTYRHKRRSNQTGTIKEEKYQGNFSSSEDINIEHTRCFEIHNNVERFKVENTVYVKNEANNIKDDHAKDCGSKSSNKLNECHQSKNLYRRNTNPTVYRDSITHCEKKIAIFNSDHTHQQKQEVIEKVKVETDVIYKKKKLNIIEGSHKIRRADDCHYKNGNETHETSKDTYRRKKEIEKERTYRKH